MTNEIWVAETVQATHNWEGAPDNRGYLRHVHAHDFKVTVWVSVSHTDRDVEFHDLREDLRRVIQQHLVRADHSGDLPTFGGRSCEAIGEVVVRDLQIKQYKVTKCRVDEDENHGAAVTGKDSTDVPLRNDRPDIVCLCGSTRFKNEWMEQIARMEREGNIALSVGSFMHADGEIFSFQQKEAMDELHKRKIDLSDWIFVLNVNGYIGTSTQSEIDYARNLGKHVTFLVNPNDSYDDYEGVTL